jgi:hypothetical protein
MQTQSSVKAGSKHEPASLIGSDRVEGTFVYRLNGKHLGTIKRVMIDKQSGHVAYAVMSFGGLLGFGNNYYPIPWSLLTYNQELCGYEVDISDAKLEDLQKSVAKDWDCGDRARHSTPL